MTTLTTFRDEPATNEDGSPSHSAEGAAAGDVTTWVYDAATGLELSKTYADGSAIVKTYDAYNRLTTETNARGNVKTHSYEHARGLHLGTTYALSSQSSGGAADGAVSYSYNHLGQIMQVVDASGTRTLVYNAYGELESDSLSVDGDIHLITELRDEFGRSIGYTYAKNGSMQQTVHTGYGTDGRINSAGFVHGGAAKNFGFEYVPGSNLLQTLSKPNGMTLTQTYETNRDLLIGMAYRRGSSLVVQREYSYDELGRPTARNTARQGAVVNDIFAHNSRSELSSARVNGVSYGYAYDSIGNREFAVEGEDTAVYTANALNQYTRITENAESVFIPEFDADGNQTRIKTETGIWGAVYNSENRPVTFSNADSGIVVESAYDSMGRRTYKRVTLNGNVTLHQRYIYRGYLQIACIDLTRSHHPALWFITWDPTQRIATRPLAIQKDGTWYTYGLDLTKNVCEVFGTTGYINTAYTYTPFGSVTATGNTTQPIQWSSEFYDSELALIYYNYRHYNPVDGRWIGRDIIEQHNLYDYVHNSSIPFYDELGMKTRVQKEEDRKASQARQKTGKMLNKEIARQSNINKLANQDTNIYTRQSVSPAAANALAAYVDSYLHYKSLQSATAIVTIINDIHTICKKRKNEIAPLHKGDGCCTIRIVIQTIHSSSQDCKILHDARVNYQCIHCSEVDFMDSIIPMQETRYAKINMEDDIVLAP